MKCARCGNPVTESDATSAKPAAADRKPADDLHAASRKLLQPSFDSWELDQNVRQLQARVAPWKHAEQPAASSAPHGKPQWRVDAMHGAPPRRHRPPARKPRRSSWAAWTVLSLGLMAFACGAVLLVWSFVERRPELWSLGMPITVAGQVDLLLGLILQLERIWQNSRDAVRKLEQVDSQLHELQQTTQRLGVTHGTAAQAFYSHLAEEASPHLLLADLQGQLDLLAQSMARRRR